MSINALGPLHVVSRLKAILTTHCREKLQMVKKMVKKWPKNRHFSDPFRVFLCDGFLENVDIYVNEHAASLDCSVEARSHSDNSLQRKARNGAKNYKR